MDKHRWPTASVSVLMPVKNTAPYLRACLDSILRQTLPSWEVIAIDDHSNDESYQILREYESLSARIKVFKNQGRGIVPALRQALALAQGEYITRMDSDDLMAPDKLGRLAEALAAAGRGHVAVGLVRYFSAGVLGQGYRQYADWLNGLTLRQANYRAIYKECVVPSPCWMAHRDDLAACGGFDPDTYPEDYDLCFRFYRHGLAVRAAPYPLHHWRDSPQRASRTDPHYADQNYFGLKLRYFLALEAPNHRLLLWGAGKKAKAVARRLQQAGRPFAWVCNNPNKHGHKVYGVEITGPGQIGRPQDYKTIVAVSARGAAGEIEAYLSAKGLRAAEDFFMFC